MSAQKQNARTSGGTTAGMTSGHRKAGKFGRDSNSRTSKATTAEAGIRRAAAIADGQAMAPLTPAIRAISASRPQRMTISIAV
jgi:hypothetical protein